MHNKKMKNKSLNLILSSSTVFFSSDTPTSIFPTVLHYTIDKTLYLLLFYIFYTYVYYKFPIIKNTRTDYSPFVCSCYFKPLKLSALIFLLSIPLSLRTFFIDSTSSPCPAKRYMALLPYLFIAFFKCSLL